MKFTSLVLLIPAFFMLVTGCASRKAVHERGWVGGEFIRAQPASWKTAGGGDHVIGAFPEELAGQFDRGLVITRLAPTSPLANSGLKETDLILALNDSPMTDVNDFHRSIDALAPGVPTKLTVYRDSRLEEVSVIVGKETFKHAGAISIGVGFKTHFEFDLYPNPDFSLAALGYNHDEQRLQLDSPKRDYIRSVNPQAGGHGIPSKEGWRAWLVILSVSSHKQILSQEAAEDLTSK